MPDDIQIEIVAADALPRCLAIRHSVFVEEMGIPEPHEVDGLDAGCVQLLLQCAGADAGTARLREHDGAAKVERVAVLADARGRGLGRMLMDALEAEARRRGFAEVVLHAQEGVIAFYEKLGYAPEGERFVEAGITHQAMRLKL
jgi:predicted GNAT family N-acyltransferase